MNTALLVVDALQPDALDDRRTCLDCARLWRTPTGGSTCITHRAAGLCHRDLADNFVTLPQRCPAWSAKS